MNLSSLKKLKNPYTEYFSIAVILVICLFIAFFKVFIGQETLLTSNYLAGIYPQTSGKPLPVYDPGASAWQYEPLYRLVENTYSKGELPLWNSHTGLGAPLAAQMQSSAFFAPQLLFSLFGHISWDFYLLFRIWLAGFFTYCFLRLLKINPSSALFGSIFFMFSGYLMMYINMAQINVEMLLPFHLWSLERLLKKENRINYTVAILSFFLGITGGMPESTFFMFLIGGLYFSGRSIALCYKNKARNKILLSLFKRYILAAFFGFALCAFLLLPLKEYLTQAFSIHTHELKNGLKTYPFLYTVSLFLPYYLGNIHQSWITDNYHLILPYLSIIGIFFAVLAIIKKPKNFIIYFFLGITVFYFLKTWGFPYVQWVGLLPFFELNSFPKYLYLETTFAIAVLAAYGTDTFIFHQNKKLRYIGGTICITAGIVITAYLGVQNNIPGYANAQLLQHIFLRGIFFLGLGTFFLLIFFWIKKIPKKFIGFLVVAILFTELYLYLPHQRNNPIDTFKIPQSLEYLKNTDPEPFRIYSKEGILHPNVSSAIDIDDIRSNDALYPNLYFNFIKKLIAPTLQDRFDGNEVSNPNYSILGALNVKYILSTKNLDSPGLDFFYKDKEIFIYKNREFLPRAYLIYNWEYEKTLEDTYKKLKSNTFDFKNEVILEGEGLNKTANPPPQQTKLKIASYTAQQIKISTETDTASVLVLSDIYYPGWQATINGVKADIHLANGALRAIFLPAGKNSIEIFYAPQSYYYGAIISIISLCILGIWLYFIKNKKSNPV